MVQRTSWSDLLPGLTALAAMIALAILTLTWSNIGGVRGKTVRLYVATDQARGVLKGTEVWIAGQQVGVVDHIGFAPPGADSMARVVIALDVRARDLAQIRRDSPAQVRPGMNVVAPSVVSLDAGTPASPAVRPGDTLRATRQLDLESAGARLAALGAEAKPLVRDAHVILARAGSREGTIGMLRADLATGGGTRASLAHLRASMTALGAQTGRARESHATLVAEARTALARVDSIRVLLASPGGSLGRWRADSTLGATIANVRDELSGISDRFASPMSGVGRFTSDSALWRAVADARREMTLLFDDVRRHPLRYVSLP